MATSSRYQFQINNQHLTVAHWKVQHFAVDSDPHCDIALARPYQGDTQTWLRQTARLCCGQQLLFSGIIAAITETVTESGELHIQLRLATALWPLRLKCFNRSLHHSSLRERITQLLQTHGLSPQRDFFCRFDEASELGLIPQINESDWIYFQRLCQAGQIHFNYSFQQNASLQLFSSWQQCSQRLWHLEILSDSAEQFVSDNSAYDFELRQGQPQTTYICFSSSQIGIEPGDCIQFDIAPALPGFIHNRRLRVLEIKQSGNSDPQGLNFQARITATFIQATLPMHRRQRTPRFGIQLATIVGNTQPSFDDQARYWLQFRHALAKHTEKIYQGPFPLATVFTAEQSGWQFALDPGTLVLCACIDDEPEAWVILGVLPQRNKQHLVTTTNANQNILRTPANQGLMMDDRPSNPTITLSSANSLQALSLSSAGIQYHSLRGDIKIIATKTLMQHCHEYQIKCVRTCQQRVQKEILFATSYGDLLCQAGNELRLLTQAEFLCQSQEIIKIQAETIQLNSRKQQSWQSNNGDIIFYAPELHLQAEQGLMAQSLQGDIVIQNGQASITLTASGKLKLQAKQVHLLAEKIQIEALQGSSVRV